MPTNRPNAAHMPNAWDPMAYEFVDAFDNMAGDPGARGSLPAEPYIFFGVTVTAYSPVGAAKVALRRLLADSPSSAYEKAPRGQQCDHCGAHLRYVCVLRHIPTGDHICVGETCLDNRVGSMDRAAWKVKELREAAARQAQAERNRGAISAFLQDNPEVAEAFARADRGEFAHHDYAQRTIADIASKLREHGGISERQAAFVVRLASEADAKLISAQATQRRMEVEAAQPRAETPTGRVNIVGVIVFTKDVCGDFGMVTKLLVRCGDEASGFYKVWVSAPRGLRFERFDVVEMKATLKRSDRDANFAFGSRPTNAVIIGHAEVTAEEMDDSLSPMTLDA